MVKMIDISKKVEQYREAIVSGEIKLKPETLKLIKEGRIEKGDPIQIAKLAGIHGAKLTPSIMPLCHPILIENVDVDINIKDDRVIVEAKVIANSKTGVEMEALTATVIALLNLWDVVKKYEKDEKGQYPTTAITNIRVVKKIKKA
jgi:cyclic pyranopterin phosphate synthase